MPTRTRRTALVVGTAFVLAVLVGVVAVLWPDPPGADPGPAELAGAETSGALGAYAPPVALAADSEYVETEVIEGDDLLVTHWIASSEPGERLRLRVPRSPGLDDLTVDVEDLVVAADGVPLDVAAFRTDVPSALPGARQLYVQYRLAGALQRNSSVTDRALATVTSLGVDLDGRALPRVQVFPGGRVMTLACLARGARAVPMSCGSFEEGAWKVGWPAGEAPVTVIAQLDLAIDR